MRKLVMFMVVGCVAVLAQTISVSAAPNPPTDASGTFPLPPEFTFCDYPIQATVTGKAKTIQTNQFLILTSPGLNITLSAHGKTASFNATGTFKITTLANGNVLTEFRGNNLVSDPKTGFLALSGHFRFVASPSGAIVENLNGTGHRTDICALLA
jgi:hypothetical protein